MKQLVQVRDWNYGGGAGHRGLKYARRGIDGGKPPACQVLSSSKEGLCQFRSGA